MRNFLLKSLIFFYFWGISHNANSQTFDDFKKQIRSEYNEFEKETQQKFDDFVTKIDKEFGDYLTNNFGSHYTRVTNFNPETPKPESIPTAVEEEIIDDNHIPYITDQLLTVYQGPVYPGIQKSEDTNFAKKRVNVDFLGWPLYFDIDKKASNIVLTNVTPEGISNYWSEMSEVNYNHFLYQIGEVSGILNLNQWAYFLLIKECSKQLYPDDKNSQTAFEWVMLTRSRYKAKIGYSDNKTTLLLPSIYTIYNTSYVMLNNTPYYVIDNIDKQIETYDKDFPETDIIMDMVINKPFYTNEIKKSRDYHFTYNKKKYTVNLKYDEEMIRFYRSIPLSDIRVYFNSVISNRTKESVKESFTPLLKDLSEEESLNLLLNFVQQGFAYKTDTYAYGKERYFFPDEVLHYPYSDCEDRSVLFAYLVKTLLEKEVAGISFPGHMATVVNTNEKITGNSLIYNNNEYIIADPTFYGAPTGMLMGTLSGKQATLIPLETNTALGEKTTKIWIEANNSGGFKADRQQDMIFDNSGNVFLCGYYTGSANFGSFSLSGSEQSRDAFITAYSSDFKPLWSIGSSGNGNNMALGLMMANNTIYVYGSFEGTMKMGNQEIAASGAPDVFVAGVNPTNGKIKWLSKAGIDKLDHSSDFMYAVKFNEGGKKIMAKLYSQKEDFSSYGLSSDENGNTLVVGSFFATSGMNSKDYTEYNIGTELNIPEVLYETDVKLKQDAYEATIAGLFSAFNLIKANSIAIEGSDIVKTFDKYNNNFSSYAGNIYNNLAKMSFMKNDKGIITIKTDAEKPILFDKIKITNDAHIRVVKYQSGNILVEVLSGVYVGGGNYWLDMNSIKLFKESGDLLFNFDTDNSVKKINLKKELLKRN